MMKIADLQAKLAELNLVAKPVQALPIPPRPSRKRKAEPCPYDDVYYTADDLTDKDKQAIALFHYAYFSQPWAGGRPDDKRTFELLKRHALLEWAPHLPLEKRERVYAYYSVNEI
jgi:hypothetical protein